MMMTMMRGRWCLPQYPQMGTFIQTGLVGTIVPLSVVAFLLGKHFQQPQIFVQIVTANTRIMSEDLVQLFTLSSLVGENAEEKLEGKGSAQPEEDEPLAYHEIMREEYESNDTRIAMIGNVDSGKSTLIGVLTNSTLDDGRGAARALVLKHRHEQENGRTSAVTVEIIGYKGDEQIIPTSRNHIQRWHEVMEKSDHSVTLIDLCGHEKYLKTTLFGLTGLMPDYALLVVGSNMGVQVMTREHISIACALNIPMFVAVTKIDICPPE